MSQWESIETAPKDGRAILIWDGEDMTTAYWFGVGKRWSVCVNGGHCIESDVLFPTHWAALPPRPET